MQIPISEIIKSIPGAVGIRLEKELPFSQLKKMGELELRHYQPFTLAQVFVAGDYDSATDQAFRTLATFIFGENSQKKSTAMTTPVFMDKTSDGWMMSFYLSGEEGEIQPLDPSIHVGQFPAKTVAVYSYSGTNDLAAMEEGKSQLLKALALNNLKPDSEVWWAQYDQPVSLPMTKRNEALVKINPDSLTGNDERIMK